MITDPFAWRVIEAGAITFDDYQDVKIGEVRFSSDAGDFILRMSVEEVRGFAAHMYSEVNIRSLMIGRTDQVTKADDEEDWQKFLMLMPCVCGQPFENHANRKCPFAPHNFTPNWQADWAELAPSLQDIIKRVLNSENWKGKINGDV